MKTLITALLALTLLAGCATPPTPPNLTQLTLDSVDRLMTGRAGTGPTADQLNQQFADYDKARAEYEQTASYKSIPYLLAPLLILGGAANGLPLGPASAKYGVYSPSNAVINTVLTGGGGYRTTVRWK